ncbi:unnamed protein product, partial [Polarella glacialis]
AYRCGVTDAGLNRMCDWLAGIDAKKMPQEIHLSHNEITTGAFEGLVSVLDVKASEYRPSAPIWIRIEGNRIKADAVEFLQKAGKACLAPGK